MKVQKFFIALIGLAFILNLIINAQETTSKDGKTVYIEAKCNTCHAISSLDIEAKNKSASNKAPDLSNVEIQYDKDFLKKYLQKEESINKKKHPVAYKGSDEDLETLLSFLLSLKPQEQPQQENEQE